MPSQGRKKRNTNKKITMMTDAYQRLLMNNAAIYFFINAFKKNGLNELAGHFNFF
jgi:hypothetical protein